MAARLRLLLPLVLVACFSCMMVDEASASWWSLGVTSCASQSTQTCENCATLESMNVLTQDQRMQCSDDASPIQAMARGTRRAIIECQKRFANSAWNCSTFVGENLFGSFVVENRTKETAILYAFLTAGAVQAVAEACHEQRIPGCPCQLTPGEPLETQDGRAPVLFTGCSDHVEWARDYVNSFVLPETPSDLGEASDKHNIENGGGIILDSDLSTSCTCHGLSGSCSVQTCYKKSVEVNEVGQDLFLRYGSAVRVELQDGELVKAGTDTDPLKATDLTFVADSPSFCNAIPAKGILGTARRECDPSTDCNYLCCGRGYDVETIEVPITECEFVYCCEIVCRQTGVKTITKYRCNP